MAFSFFEILISLVIIGILSAIAIPSYQEHVVHAKRMEAEVALSKLAVALEQYYSAHNTYKNADLVTLNIAPMKNYQLQIISTTDSDFSIAAQPILQQAVNDSGCGTLTLNSNGAKGFTGTSTTEECWENE